MDLHGKVVVITGASMGIGEALTRAFAKRGSKVVMSSRSLERIEAARQRVGCLEQTVAFACDVQKPAELEALLAFALERFGRVDVWINNAGFGVIDSVARVDTAAVRSMFETNLFGVIQAMQLVVPRMKEQGAGTIVNVSSVAGHIAMPYMGLYSASKHALNAIGRAARMELKKHKINVLTVCPGYIATDFSANAVRGSEQKRFGGAPRFSVSAERVAEATVRGVVRGKREVIVPWWYRIFIKLYQTAPRFVESVVRRATVPADKVIAATVARKAEFEKKR
jgi:short-subunit dehydrogenase